jgi:glycosyltransferase involved in cell wall biosynthesis
MKLNWFCPLPPAKSGIAVDFFRTILPALSSRADVTLWTDQNTWTNTLENYARVRTFRLENIPWVELNRADITFFNLGNNHLFHGTIWEVSRRLSGITILHDFRLDEFFENWCPDRLPAPRLKYKPRSEQSMVNLEFALENSLGVVVHTQEAYDQLNVLNRWIVAYVPLAFSLPTSARGAHKRIDMPPYCLIVFGFIHKNRRLPALLEALGTFAQKDKFQLKIYGDLWDPGLVKRTIAEYGLEKQVSIKGFVSELALDQALASADLAVNLRYPSTEASGSQLRIWSHELPSIVTRAGWFASLPESVVAHVSPEREVADIQKHLQSFLNDRAQFARMGAEGKRRLYPTHAPETYVESLLKLAEQTIEFRPRAVAHRLAQRSGECMSPWIEAVSSEDPLRRVADEIITLTGRPEGSVSR